MDTKIYYDHKDKGLLITSNFAKWKKNIDLGIYPNTYFEEISIIDIEKHSPTDIAFDEVDISYFQSIKEIITNYKFQFIAFHNSSVDLSSVILNVKHLLIGDSSKINLAAENFNNLEEITFLSVKTFKGKILDKIESVAKLTLWYESKQANSILSMFPNLKELIINNGTIEELDLTGNPLLGKLQLHNCTKLERVVVKPEHHFEKVFVERCKKLDIGNLGNNVKKVG